ncbi:hypothetical protein FDJ25_gp133 [Vibrio phage Aphrodite1]|uniref:Uncharacterized protein n=1 Tax=Vibrio phage Aphrodite1 TaxID=2070057 RepID=A0A2I7QHV5_9CAUD|nr:hypothetical protein FDJ25_gp133 [Vibrio phage Aphrodite1]AUR80980.1 hypothetical protein Aphrodite1_0068 [Vibrio phage Aphrodite1]
MSVKIPSNYVERPHLYNNHRAPHREYLNIEVVNYTTSNVYVKRGPYNTISKPLTIVEDERCCVEFEVTFSFNFENRPSFYEPETPLDIYIMSKIREYYRNKSEEELIAYGGQINGRFLIGVGRANLGEYIGSDGGIHSRLLGISVYPFLDVPEDFHKSPSPYYGPVTTDENGNRIDSRSPTQVIYEYYNNSNPEATIYTPVNGRVLKLVPKQDPSIEDGIKMTVVSPLGKKESFIELPDSFKDRDKFFKVLEENNFYLSSSDALESINSKSLQQALSMVSQLQKELKASQKETLNLREAHGKLKDANSKQQIKHEQTSLWSKLLETIIKVPFTIIAHLLEVKLTQVLGPKLLMAVL